MPQPNLVPVIPRVSRSTHNSGIWGTTSTDCDFPLTVNLTAATGPPFGLDIQYTTGQCASGQYATGQRTALSHQHGVYSTHADAATARMYRIAARAHGFLRGIGLWGGRHHGSLGLSHRRGPDAAVVLVRQWNAAHERRQLPSVRAFVPGFHLFAASSGWPAPHRRRTGLGLAMYFARRDPILETERHDLQRMAKHRRQPDTVSSARVEVHRCGPKAWFLRPFWTMAGAGTGAGRPRGSGTRVSFRTKNRACVGDAPPGRV